MLKLKEGGCPCRWCCPRCPCCRPSAEPSRQHFLTCTKDTAVYPAEREKGWAWLETLSGECGMQSRTENVFRSIKLSDAERSGFKASSQKSYLTQTVRCIRGCLSIFTCLGAHRHHTVSHVGTMRERDGCFFCPWLQAAPRPQILLIRFLVLSSHQASTITQHAFKQLWQIAVARVRCRHGSGPQQP